jgi:prolyl-tRNA synthetase
VIVRQRLFPIPVLRQAPAGLDPVTASAARGGYLQVTSEGLSWLPLGARLVDRLRSLFRGQPAGEILAAPTTTSSSIFELLKSERRFDGDTPWVGFAEWPPAAKPGRSLKDPGISGVLEWGAAAADEELAGMALTDVEERLAGSFSRCQLEVERAEGVGSETQWVFLGEVGPSRFLRCDGCGYMGAREAARFALTPSPAASSEPRREVHTPGASTIKILCDQLGIPPTATLKALFLTADGKPLLALLRGDLEASLPKLRHGLGAQEVRPAAVEEINRLGASPGYAGPVGLQVRHERRGEGVWVVADRSVIASPNLVTGANREGYHFLGVNYPRDFAVTEVLDFARSPSGAPCARCGGTLAEEKGVVLVRRQTSIGRLDLATGIRGSRPRTLVALQLSLGALLTAIFTTARQGGGLRFPWACAPFHVHWIQLAGGPDVSPVIAEIGGRGLDVLIDDRDVSAGAKFAEGEWIGCPLQIVSGRKSGEAGGAEVALPNGSRQLVRMGDLLQFVLLHANEVM